MIKFLNEFIKIRVIHFIYRLNTGGIINVCNSGDFGADFIKRPNFTPELDRWYCYELMVKANTPGQRDGRIAFWVDGVLTADFGNIRFRELDSIKIDKFSFGFHARSNPTGETTVWYDNIVIADSYIGPMVKL